MMVRIEITQNLKNDIMKTDNWRTMTRLIVPLGFGVTKLDVSATQTSMTVRVPSDAWESGAIAWLDGVGTVTTLDDVKSCFERCPDEVCVPDPSPTILPRVDTPKRSPLARLRHTTPKQPVVDRMSISPELMDLMKRSRKMNVDEDDEWTPESPAKKKPKRA